VAPTGTGGVLALSDRTLSASLDTARLNCYSSPSYYYYYFYFYFYYF
jgi:hypothetical protein